MSEIWTGCPNYGHTTGTLYVGPRSILNTTPAFKNLSSRANWTNVFSDVKPKFMSLLMFVKRPSLVLQGEQRKVLAFYM